MPALSPTMETGSISQWKTGEGETFTAGDVLCEIETDKATIDFEAQDDGIIAKILRSDSNAIDLPVGVPICVVVDDVADVSAFTNFVLEDDNDVVGTDATASAAATESSVGSAEGGGGETAFIERDVPSEMALMPSARHLSESRGLDATVLPGSGKGGRVTKGDILKAIADGIVLPPLGGSASVAASSPPPPAATATADVPPPSSPVLVPPTTTSLSPSTTTTIPEIHSIGSHEDIPNNNMRKVIARRLTESKRDVPHFYTSIEVPLDSILALRKDLAKNHDAKVSVNDLIIRSSALALRDVPEVNATYDISTGYVSVRDTIDISVAVATPTGLITPIVPRTDTLGLMEITTQVRDLASRARIGKLQPHEYQGGTFCISNLGMFGVNEFSAVINPPQAAILAVGGGTRTIVPTPYDGGKMKDEQEKPSICTIMTARLSADRRVVDEATAAMFLQCFKHYITEPKLLIL